MNTSKIISKTPAKMDASVDYKAKFNELLAEHAELRKKSAQRRCHLYLTDNTGVAVLRVTFTLSVREYRELKAAGCIQVWEENRAEVKKRKGDANMYNESSKKNISLGQYLGFSTMSMGSIEKHARDGDIKKLFTAENPLYVSEGGHRTRWIDTCEDTDAPITISFISTDNESLRERLVREEFTIVNTLAAIATTGETLPALTSQCNDKRNESIKLIHGFLEKYEFAMVDDRGKHNEIENAMINAIRSGNLKMLHTKASIADDVKKCEIDEAALERCKRVVGALDEIYAHVATLAPEPAEEHKSLKEARMRVEELAHKRGVKAAQAALKKEEASFSEANGQVTSYNAILTKMRICDLQFLGPLMYGFLGDNTCDDEKKLAQAVKNVKDWFSKSILNEELEDRFMLATAPLPGARSFTEERYKVGWSKIVGYIKPKRDEDIHSDASSDVTLPTHVV
jgi:hypothetical protein